MRCLALVAWNEVGISYYTGARHWNLSKRFCYEYIPIYVFRKIWQGPESFSFVSRSNLRKVLAMKSTLITPLIGFGMLVAADAHGQQQTLTDLNLPPAGTIVAQALEQYRNMIKDCPTQPDALCMKKLYMQGERELNQVYNGRFSYFEKNKAVETAKLRVIERAWATTRAANCKYMAGFEQWLFYDCMLLSALERKYELLYRIGD